MTELVMHIYRLLVQLEAAFKKAQKAAQNKAKAEAQKAKAAMEKKAEESAKKAKQKAEDKAKNPHNIHIYIYITPYPD